MAWRSIFLGPRGLRAGWRALLFEVLSNAIIAAPFLLLLALRVPQPKSMSAGVLLGGQLIQILGVFATIAILARIERRPIGTYGLTARGAFGARFWNGALWGLAAVSAVVGLIAGGGGYRLGALALHGEALLKSAVLWALATTAIAVFEEWSFRGYLQLTLTEGIGFWPAAVVISALFAGEHFFLKPGETWVDAASVGMIGMFFCLMVRRTGDLWFPIGWHAAFNFGQFALWGGPNSANQGRPFEGRLFASSFHGPAWLTGGPLGIEASAFVFPVVALSIGLFLLLFRRARWPVQAQPHRAEILELEPQRSRAG